MPRTAVVLAAIALLSYGSSAYTQAGVPPSGSPQAAAPPTGQPAQEAAATNDEELTKAVRSALDADPHHYFRHVNVRVENGVATLSGFVWSSSAINRARTITGKVPGVTRVVSGNLQLQPNRPR